MMLLFLTFLLTRCAAASLEQPLLALENTEHVLQISPQQPNSLQFLLKKHTPLWIAVTPCGGTVHWQLFQSYKSEDNDHSLTNVQDVNKNLITEKFRFDTEAKLLAGEADEKRMIYFAKRVEKGLHTIVLSSNIQTSAKIFFTKQKRKLDWQYPAKPYDPTVRTTLLVNTAEQHDDTVAINVRWLIPLEIEAISSFNEGAQASKRYRFCVTVSRKQPEWTMCDDLGANLESVHCVNQTTNTLNISKLKTGNLYYITVFIRDVESGGTTALEPSGIFIPPSSTGMSNRHDDVVGGDKKIHKLPDAKLKNGKLAGRQGYLQSYRFHIHQATANQRKILIVVYSCNGFLRIAVRRKGEEIFRSNSFSGYHRFLVTDVVMGYITVDVINDDEKTKNFRIWASTAPQKIPYPQMPENTSIKIMKRTCSSVTLQWMKSHNTEVRYCLYKRKEEARDIGELIEKNRDFCHNDVPGSDLVACYTIYTKSEAFVLKPAKSAIRSYDYEGDAYNPIFETSVNGLDAGTTYHFDLLAQPLHRFHTQHLPYRTVWARTLSC